MRFVKRVIEIVINIVNSLVISDLFCNTLYVRVYSKSLWYINYIE